MPNANFKGDFSGLAQFAAATKVLDSQLNDGALDEMIEDAWREHLPKFHAEAATLGQTGIIKHMFEYGTKGVNRGRTNMAPSPMSPAARLWLDVSVKAGSNRRDIGFVFRPAKAYTPLPTVGGTGMSSDVISKMRKHVFEDKARVMELGTSVDINPVEAEGLLIPIYKRGSTLRNIQEYERKRGYRFLRRGVTAVPGNKTKGTFTAFWSRHWETKGQLDMQRYIQKRVDEDVKDLMLKNSAPPKFRRITKTTFDLAVDEETRRLAALYRGRRFRRR